MGRRGLRQGWGFGPPGGVLIEVRDDELLRIPTSTGERGQTTGIENRPKYGFKINRRKPHVQKRPEIRDAPPNQDTERKHTQGGQGKNRAPQPKRKSKTLVHGSVGRRSPKFNP